MSIMFTIESWYILIPLFGLYVAALLVLPPFAERKYSASQTMLLIAFGLYLSAVIHLVFFPIDVNIGRYANQIPWYKSINIIPLVTLDVKTFLLNILMLVPLGIILPLVYSRFRSIKDVALLGFGFSLSIELLQLLIRVTLGSGRSTDINDLIANTVGCILGFMILKILKRFPCV
ncbi:VanZ like family protein [compost metagenome]